MEPKNEIKKQAKSFVTFKSHLTFFILANIVIWTLWLINDGTDLNSWPLYISIGWAVILAIHFIFAYELFQPKKK
jgi:hypothetical protein